MNIIFGNTNLDELAEKYILLELDTITIRGLGPTKTYCIIDTLSPDNLAKAPPYIKLHSEFISNYHNRNWNFCLTAMPTLVEFWGSNMSSFYDIIKIRIEEFQSNPPDENWTSVIEK